jgi:hypothetical protein
MVKLAEQPQPYKGKYSRVEPCEHRIEISRLDGGVDHRILLALYVTGQRPEMRQAAREDCWLRKKSASNFLIAPTLRTVEPNTPLYTEAQKKMTTLRG